MNNSILALVKAIDLVATFHNNFRQCVSSLISIGKVYRNSVSSYSFLGRHGTT
jgi:hypothetical protein